MLDWISAEEGRKIHIKIIFSMVTWLSLLTVCDWITVHGYRDIRTGMAMDPVYVTYINLPENIKEDI